MSNLQELIHTTLMQAYEQGVSHERKRIIELFKQDLAKLQKSFDGTRQAAYANGMMDLLRNLIQYFEESEGENK